MRWNPDLHAEESSLQTQEVGLHQELQRTNTAAAGTLPLLVTVLQHGSRTPQSSCPQDLAPGHLQAGAGFLALSLYHCIKRPLGSYYG